MTFACPVVSSRCGIPLMFGAALSICVALYVFYSYSEMRRLDARVESMTSHLSAQLKKVVDRIDQIDCGGGGMCPMMPQGGAGAPMSPGFAQLSALLPMLFDDSINDGEDYEEVHADLEQCVISVEDNIEEVAAAPPALVHEEVAAAPPAPAVATQPEAQSPPPKYEEVVPQDAKPKGGRRVSKARA